MCLAIAVGNYRVRERATDDLGPCPPEQEFRLCAPAGDSSRGVDRDHGIQCRFDNQARALFACLQRTLSTLLLRLRVRKLRRICPDETRKYHGARERKQRHTSLYAEPT